MHIAHFDPYLYTYCSLSTLKTITEKGTLRFSDIRKSNDSKELVYGFNQIKKRLVTLIDDDRKLMIRCEKALATGQVTRNAKHLRIEAVSEDAVELCEAYNKRLYAYFVEHYFDEDDLVEEEDFLKVCDFVVKQLAIISRAMRREREGKPYDIDSARILIPRCLTLCFTGNGDLLSQWRGYGDDGRGVAVGFRRADINALLTWWNKFSLIGKHRKIHHGAVYYRDMDDSFISITTKEMRHRRFMEERWELTRGNMLRRDEISECDMPIFNMLSKYLRNGIPEETYQTARQRNIKYVFDTCKGVAPLFKQRLFFEEEEERLFLWIAGGQAVEGLDRYMSQETGRVVSEDGTLTSYLDIAALKHVEKGTDSLGPAPIVTMGKIVLGPRCKASEHDIASLFSGYPERPRIVRSSIPYVG